MNRRPVILFLFLFAGAALAGDNARFDVGDRLMAAGRCEEALEIWTQELRATPDDVDLLLRAGIACSMLDDRRRAEEYLLDARRRAPDDPRPVYNHALLELRRGRTERARALLEETLRIRDWFPGASFHLGLLAEREGRLDEADRLYVREMNADHGSAAAWQRHMNLQRDNHRSADGPVIIACLVVGAAALVFGCLWRKGRSAL